MLVGALGSSCRIAEAFVRATGSIFLTWKTLALAVILSQIEAAFLDLRDADARECRENNFACLILIERNGDDFSE